MFTMFFLAQIFLGCTVIHGAILGEQNKNVILPCSFKPEEEVVIHWTTRDKKNVHSYYWTKDQLEKQDKSYSGRTSLFLKEISEGNASLQIRNLRKSDENTYKCYVGRKADHKEEEISLQVIGAILGEQNREVILPCSFKPGEEVVIHWTTRDKINVHSYYWTKDQLEKQDKSYSGRTSLFLKEISEGNASLQIRNLRKSDENTYKCYVGTKADHKEEIISLQVIDLQRTMEYNRDDNDWIHLTCSVTAPSSKDIIIKWYENDIKIQEDESTHSTYPVRNNSLKYQCTVDHSTVQSSWTGTWTMNESIKRKDDSVTCGCNFCEDGDTDFYAEWNFTQGTNEVPIAAMNNSLANISTAYETKVIYGEHSLNLSKLSANDNGLYICLIETEQKVSIEMTRVNITAEKETRQRKGLIAALVAIPLMILIACIICRKKITRKTAEENQ
ncbi:HERV-H LTR-associating protein 2 isoform X1 [Phyllobates terribilis]|uniref:HERV-H LTR-associating protein 2 isoform X1 n=1 Tax=Phyllobates terribilis TaxID=111132 RepID=UPI003CCB3385